MGYASSSSAISLAGLDQRQRASVLFKADHLRAIDRYIDYFGGARAPAAHTDTCGEWLLEQLRTS